MLFGFFRFSSNRRQLSPLVGTQYWHHQPNLNLLAISTGLDRHNSYPSLRQACRRRVSTWLAITI
jgi:hypothetical protein